MLPQYNSSPLTQEAAQLAVRQQLAADRSTRLDCPAEGEPNIPTLVEPSPSPGCEHLRHIIIGSPEGVQEAIARLHLLHYVERHYWTPLIAIGAQGIRLTPAQGQVLSYLVQQRPLR